MTTKVDLLAALKLKYEGQRAAAAANLYVYLERPVGIGEHPDIIEAMDEILSKFSEADEKIHAIQSFIKDN